MTNWNPSSPTVVGLERAAATLTPISLDGRATGAGQLIVSTVNETIVDMGVPVTIQGTRQLIYEVYDAANLLCTGIATVKQNNQTAVRAPGSNPPAIPGGYTSSSAIVNDGSSTTGRMRFDATFQSVRTTWDFRGTVAAGKRILRVDVSFGVYGLGGYLNVYWADRNDTDLNVQLGSIRGWSNDPIHDELGVKFSSELCPWTGQPWVRDDLTALYDPGGSTNTKELWLVYGRESGSTWLKYVNIEVHYCNENRLAYGAQMLTPTGLGDYVPLYHGADTRTANYAKSNTTPFLFASVRRAWQSPQIDSGNATATGNTANVALTGVTGGVTSIGDAGGAPTQVTGIVLSSTIVPVVLRKAGAVGSVNSVPYTPTHSTIDDTGWDLQNFVAPANGTYSLVTIALAAVDVGTSTLQVTVKNHGSGVTLATGTITTAQLLTGTAVGTMPSLGNVLNFRLGRITVTPFNLTIGMSVDVILQRIGALPVSSALNQGWQLLTQTAVTKETADWNGTWNNGSGGWSLSARQADASLTVSTAPTPLGGFTATVELQTTDTGDWCGTFMASVDGIDLVRLNWTSSSLGADFGYYELQRMDARTDWATIARITDETVSDFDDYETRIGVATSYRVRVVRDDGAPSTWTGPVGPVVTSGESAELLFTTNEDPLRNVAYFDVYDDQPSRTYGFPEAQEVTFIAMHGRDLAVAFHPSERRGVEFDRLLLLNGLAAVAEAGPPVVDPLRDLAWAPLAYVCVRDTSGNRWFAALVVSGADVAEQRNIYHAQVYVREVASDPSTPNAPGVVATEAIAELWP